MWYFVRWTLGTVEIDTGFACKAEAVRFANAKNGTLITRMSMMISCPKN